MSNGLIASLVAWLSRVQAGLTDTRMANLDNLDAAISGISGGGMKKVQVYTSGSGSWSVPAAAEPMVLVTLCGGGGGAVGSGSFTANGGGGAESMIRQPYEVTPGGSEAYQVGAGGAGSDDGVAGNGGDSYFGTGTEHRFYALGGGGAPGRTAGDFGVGGGQSGGATNAADGTLRGFRMGGGAGRSEERLCGRVLAASWPGCERWPWWVFAGARRLVFQLRAILGRWRLGPC